MKKYLGPVILIAGLALLLVEPVAWAVGRILYMTDQGEVQFYEAAANGQQKTTVRAAASLANDYTITLPTSAGAAGQFLSTDGTGTLAWGNSGAASLDSAYDNSPAITADAGPVAISASTNNSLLSISQSGSVSANVLTISNLGTGNSLNVASGATFMAGTLRANGAATLSSTITKSGPYVNVKHADFGAVGNGSTDDTAAVQSAINHARETGIPLYFPKGRYRIVGQLSDYSGGGSAEIQLTMVGDGMYESVILDANASAPCIDFDAAPEGQLTLKVKDLGFEATVTKHTQLMTRWKLSPSDTSSVFDHVRFDGSASNFMPKALAEFVDAFTLTFIEPRVQRSRVGLRFIADNTNSGNVKFLGGSFFSIRTAIHARGGAQNNNFTYLGTKFNLPGGIADHKQMTPASDWTAASTSITIDTGLNLISGDVLAIVGSAGLDVVAVETYDSGTGVAVLRGALEYDHYQGGAGAACEIFGGGSIAVANGLTVPATAFYNCHFEGASILLYNSSSFTFDGCLHGSSVLTNGLAQGQEHGIFITGQNSFAGSIVGSYYDGTRSDDKLVKIVKPAFGSNNPGYIYVGPSTRVDGGLTTLDSIVNVNNSNIRFSEFSGNEKITFRGDTNIYRGGANLLKTDDSMQVVGNLTVDSAATIAGTAGITGLITGSGGLTLSSGALITNAIMRLQKAGAEVTIASGAITYARAYTFVGAETGTTDDLDTINSPINGDILILEATSGDTITVREVGNIRLGATTRVLNSVDDKLILIFNATNWNELAFIDNT